MNRLMILPALLASSLLGEAAHAQQSFGQGPVLIPPSQSSRFGHRDDRSPEIWRSDRESSYYSAPPSRFEDPQMRQIAHWYRQFFGREMARVERVRWEGYLSRNEGTLADVLVMLLGGDEFYVQSGKEIEGWLGAVAAATGDRLSRSEAARWHDIYHQRPTDRITFTRRFLEARGVIRPGGEQLSLEHTHLHPQDTFRPPVISVPPQRPGRDLPPIVVDHRHPHEHTTGYGPRAPTTPSEMIAGWYATYFGREIAPHELNKWISDLNRGMPLDEVYASVLGAPEWYGRTGGTPSRWVGATLEALGQRASPDALNYWLDQLRRRDGDRFKTALDMVRRYGMPAGPGFVGHDLDHRHAGHRRGWDDDD